MDVALLPLTHAVGWHCVTSQKILQDFTRPTTLKNSSLLTHISQWQYKVGFTTWTTPHGLSLLTVYKPYDLISYDTRAATSWNSCTGYYKREHFEFSVGDSAFNYLYFM